MRTRTATTFALAALGLWACHFDVAGVAIPNPPTEDLAVVDSAVTDLAVEDDLAGPDLAGLCAPGGPTRACAGDGTTLITCQGTTPTPQTCDDGCSSDGGPHCRRLDPSGAAAPSDYEKPGLADVTLAGTVVFNTDTGEITATPVDRAGGLGVSSGIGFSEPTQSNGSAVGVFAFASLSIAPGATVRVVGQKPLVLVASGNITISGEIDVRGDCASGVAVAGGGLGGAPKAGTGNPGGGLGAGLGGASGLGGGGGGGGGFGDIGGTGATGSMGGTGGAGGPLFGDLTLADPILNGGGGGGAGGGATGGGAGGAGGGVVQIAANAMVIIADSAAIQAGGCRGSATASGFGGGGGGGAGGAILVEGRVVQVGAGATLTANGGGGGGGGGGGDGEDGQLNENAASGGSGGGGANKGSRGGDGGATGTLFGAAGAVISPPETHGGGGGGGVGRIALKSRSGTVTTTGVILSPKIDEATPGRAAPARIGTVSFR